MRPLKHLRGGKKISPVIWEPVNWTRQESVDFIRTFSGRSCQSRDALRVCAGLLNVKWNMIGRLRSTRVTLTLWYRTFDMQLIGIWGILHLFQPLLFCQVVLEPPDPETCRESIHRLDIK